jgi:hypothetical protein
MKISPPLAKEAALSDTLFDQILGSDDIGFDGFKRIKLAGREMFERGGVKNNINVVKRRPGYLQSSTGRWWGCLTGAQAQAAWSHPGCKSGLSLADMSILFGPKRTRWRRCRP